MNAEIQATDVSESVREAFNFTVDKFPLGGPDGLTTPWYGLFRSDSMDVVGSCSVSSRYVPHTTDDVCALIDAASNAFDGEIECKTHFRDGHFVSIAPTREHRIAIYGEHDNIWPRVIIKAGYDKKAFSATMGYYRDACDNLAMMRQVSGTTVSIRHTSGLRDHMDSLITTFNVLKESWATLVDVIQRLETVEVRISDFLNQIYEQPTEQQLAIVASGQALRSVTVHRNRTEKIWNRLNRERNSTGRPILTDTVSAWEAFNCVQGFVQHDAQARTGFKGEFDRILRASQDEAVRKAESIVLSLVAV